MVKEIKDGKVTEKNLKSVDFKKISEFICDTKSTRKRKRKDREKLWKEVDRQLRLEPFVPYKKGPGGKAYNHKKWMPELEIPNQAQALEILMSDALRMMLPDTGPWFATHSDIEESGIQLPSGQDISVLTQEVVDQFVESYILHTLSKFNYRKVWDLLNCEAFKYGNGVGRPRFVQTKDGKFPGLAPLSIKNTYLDDMETLIMAEGVHVRPGVIFCKHMKLADLQLSAFQGEKDPEKPNGGWMPDLLKGLEGNKSNLVEVIEFEGDLVVPMNSTTEVIENVIATAIVGKKGNKADHNLIRLRFREFDGPAVINVPYHLEDVKCPYGTSPLMKGVPVQKAASEALNRSMQAAILNTEPPLNIPKDDAFFTGEGFTVEPGAQWKGSKPIAPVEIGNPAALFGVYADLNRQYADLTGINAPRLGQQTNSHTTAFAKDQEIERGQIRTVDYVRTTIHGAISDWLKLHYKMARDSLDEERIWMTRRGKFETVTQETLPENVRFEVFGAAGPQESLARMQQKREALLTLIQVNQLGVQMGTSEPINLKAIEKFLIQEAGISESEIFTGNTGISTGTQNATGMGAIPPGSENSGNASAIIQALAFGGQQ